MLSYPSTIVLNIDELSPREFCDELHNDLRNGIGHKSTIELINKLCNTNFDVNRIQIQLINNDVLLIPQIMKRLEEGRILTSEEIEDMLKQGLIKFLRIKVNYI